MVKEIYFTTLYQEKNHLFGEEMPSKKVIRHNDGLVKLYSVIYPNNPADKTTIRLPYVNFNQEMVIGVFSGAKPRGGHGIQIEKVLNTGEVLEVIVKETDPVDEDQITLMHETYPGHVIKVPRYEGEIRFIEKNDEEL